MMTLAELLDDLDHLDGKLTIYAVKDPDWSANSLAVARLESDKDEISDAAHGMSYFLEVYIAREVMEEWADRHDGQEPTIDDKCRAIIYYAENDAYLPE